jgi:1-acyl-sn-glycerol-3-phosphate acyltransferase
VHREPVREQLLDLSPGTPGQDLTVHDYGEHVSKPLGRAFAGAIGWKVMIEQPPPPRCVVIGAPHTSNLDLVITLILMWATNLRFRWLAKDELFRWPVAGLLRRLGGWPVNRRSRNDLVQQMVDAFRTEEELMIAILPEGSRSRRQYWKTGFYYMALGAGVPIVFGYADYRRRVVGLGPSLVPSGDIQADFRIIQAFYAGVKGRHPDRQGQIMIEPAADPVHPPARMLPSPSA